MIRVFLGPVGRMVLRILHEKMQAAHDNFKTLRKQHKQEYKQAKQWAKENRARSVASSLQNQVKEIFKGI